MDPFHVVRLGADAWSAAGAAFNSTPADTAAARAILYAARRTPQTGEDLLTDASNGTG